MYPEIIIGNMAISTWYLMTLIDAFVVVALAVYLRPAGFSYTRIQIFLAAVLAALGNFFGGRILFLILNHKTAFVISDLFSLDSGFAYFGSLVLAVIALWIYSAASKKSFFEAMDYGMPFLMLSQAIVRVGCFLAGCCYGKPTGMFFGVIFKTVDSIPRHPTQAYESMLLLMIYLAGRNIYSKRKNMGGYASFFVLGLYGTGRFVIEYLRVDSPVIFLNLTLAQLTCLGLAVISFLTCRIIIKRATV